MPLDLQALVAPEHTALVLQEVQNGVVGSPSALPALAEAAAAVDLIGNCARLARPARAIGVTVLHCTAETRDDGRGANRNARLFAGREEVAGAPVARAAPRCRCPTRSASTHAISCCRATTASAR